MSTANPFGAGERNIVSVENPSGIYSDVTTRDIARVEAITRATVQELAYRDIDSVSSRAAVRVRDLLPAADLESGAQNNWDGNDRRWEQTGMANTDFTTANEVYTVDADGGAQNKVIAIFGISTRSPTSQTTEIAFQESAGGTYERLQVEGLLNDEESFGLLANPVVYGANIEGSILQFAGAADDRIVYHGAVAESTAETLTQTDRNLTSQMDRVNVFRDNRGGR